MKTVTATEARRRFYALLGEAEESHEPIQITSKKGTGILLSEENWRAIQETLYLISIPGMRESIMEGLVTPVEKCDSKVDW